MFRSSLASTFAVAFAFLALAMPVRSAPFTGHFEELRAELEERRDNDLAGELDAAGRKRLKAVVRALAALEKPADDLGDDLKTFGRAGGFLAKAFPEEFVPQENKFADFGDLIGTIADALSGEVSEVFGALAARTDALSAGAAAKVQAILDRADALMPGLPDPVDPKAFAKGRSKALRLLLKGTKVADRDDAAGGGNSTLTLMVNGTPLAGDATTKVEIHQAGDRLVIVSACPAPEEGATYYLVIELEDVTGVGTYPLASGGNTAFVNRVPDGAPGTTYDATGGSVDVTFFDRRVHVSGNFNFPAQHQTQGSLTIGASVFDIYDIERY